MSKVRVLVVDDSALIRQMIPEILTQDPGIEVVGTAANPYEARELIKKLNPDVLTLDVEMPRMDGITFLSNLMRLRPMPVIMLSTLTEGGAKATLDALELGAVDFVTKPKLDLVSTLESYGDDLRAKVKSAARVPVQRRTAAPARTHSAAARSAAAPRHLHTTDQILAIGASTGGTEALRCLFTELPPDTPGTLVTQHIPEAFSRPFADRLNDLSAMEVCQAEDGQPVLPGHGYVAPGDKHLLLHRDGARYVCRLSDADPVNRHRPSVDVLFESVARCAADNAVGVLLTGMGCDGAKGLLTMKETGAPTIAQDEKTSVVWGMPGEAVRMGAADEVVSLDQMRARIHDALKQRV